MDWKMLMAKFRPTAVAFALIMGGLSWILIDSVLAGPIGAAALGPAQSGAVLASTLIVIGVAVGALGSAMLKLSEDGPPPQVPAEVMLAFMRAYKNDDPPE